MLQFPLPHLASIFRNAERDQKKWGWVALDSSYAYAFPLEEFKSHGFNDPADDPVRLPLRVLGIPPTRKSVFVNPTLVKQYRWYPDQLKALEAGRARPRVKDWQQIEAILGDALQLALTGQAAPDAALHQAAQKIAQANAALQ